MATIEDAVVVQCNRTVTWKQRLVISRVAQRDFVATFEKSLDYLLLDLLIFIAVAVALGRREWAVLLSLAIAQPREEV